MVLFMPQPKEGIDMTVFKISDMSSELEGVTASWPYKTMAVGDAVWASDTPNPASAVNYAHTYGNANGKKFKSKKIKDKGALIWRVE